MGKKVLSFDFGASSGRAIIFEVVNKKLHSEEVHRFSNEPVSVNGTLYWDALRLFHEIKQGILKAKLRGGFDSIGIDTWGVDFGLIDKRGDLIANPVHYRDRRTKNQINVLSKKMDDISMYLACGLQMMEFNSIYQLNYLFENRQDILSVADKLLFMPDLFSYMLTGEKKSEFSIASTSQMINHDTNDWNIGMLKKLFLPYELLSPIINSGETYGKLKKEIADELGVKEVPIIAVACHDTASAVVAIPSASEDFMFLSCGTWSLMGTELDHTVISDESFKLSLTNERGYNKTTRLLKNIMGLWVIQECKKQWAKEGADMTYPQIVEEARKAEPFKHFINVDAEDFLLPQNMPLAIQDYCKKTGQTSPQSVGEISRCIFESLAFKYKNVFESIENVIGKKFDSLNIVGGGSNNQILCQFTADALGKTVFAGPSEGTAMGNAAVQLISLGVIKDIKEARDIIKKSTEIKEYLPSDVKEWQNEYNKRLKLM